MNTAKSEENLLNCYICSGEMKVKEYQWASSHGFYVECVNCLTQDCDSNTKEEAIEAWNQRA